MKLTREPDTARDLMQQSALRALSSRESPSDEKAALAWLFTIIRNVWIDQTRRRAVRDLAETGPEDEAPGSFRDDMITTLAVKQALSALCPTDRQVLMLVDLEGRTYREAAAIMGVPTGTVMSRLSRARSRMLAAIAADPAQNPDRETR
ncbi:RNA polymerase sigma factor [Microvirga sp. 17 mud 1-3]|uniref:RNA polymerase sigma factor n=1 Tax=Microvirga sp. 17 mud 1-3 TaxID=2082949 RepID=UPI001FE1A3C0|nr:RNA polymerase sigma factor [Microvirga sp. 17 mud 1-3]